MNTKPRPLTSSQLVTVNKLVDRMDHQDFLSMVADQCRRRINKIHQHFPSLAYFHLMIQAQGLRAVIATNETNKIKS